MWLVLMLWASMVPPSITRSRTPHGGTLRSQYRNYYAVASVEEYEKFVVKMVEKTNIMSGNKFMERSDTPGYCSPSSEAYWSM